MVTTKITDLNTSIRIFGSQIIKTIPHVNYLYSVTICYIKTTMNEIGYATIPLSIGQRTDNFEKKKNTRL